MDFWLVTTNHLEDRVLFRDDEDYKAAMNYVAVVKSVTKVSILAFILMSNHVHFVLECGREDADLFIRNFKQRYSIYLRRKYGAKEFWRDNEVDIRPLRIDDESLLRAIAYTLMNCVAANICLHCSQYQWGSGNCVFNPAQLKGTPLRNLSFRKQYELFHTNEKLPYDYLLGEEGYILPQSYIAVDFVEKLFRTPSRFNFFLTNSSKAKARLENTEAQPSFKDKSIMDVMPDLLHSMFHKQSLQELTDSQRAELLRQIRKRFSMDIAQMARITGITYPEITRYLEDF